MAHPAAPSPVTLAPDPSPGADAALPPSDLAFVAAHATDVPALLDRVTRIAPSLPAPGEGDTVRLWSALASVAAADVGAARVLEPHLDALTILRQAPDGVDLGLLDAGPASTWGVYAAEGPGVRVEARPDAAGEGWVLDGTKPWCSLARHLSHALVTAWVGDERRLFAVALRTPHVRADEGPWVARGLTQVVSAPVHLDSAPAVPVGPTGWYLRRPGFAWGGIGVAACWWGGAVGLARSLWSSLQGREAQQLALAHLGAVDVALGAARSALAEAAVLVDGRVDGGLDGGLDDAVAGLTARRVRTVVADTVEEVQRRCAHAMGPGPLTTDEAFARRVADLGLYVRQHHAERDQASQGRDLLARGELPW